MVCSSWRSYSLAGSAAPPPPHTHPHGHEHTNKRQKNGFKKRWFHRGARIPSLVTRLRRHTHTPHLHTPPTHPNPTPVAPPPPTTQFHPFGVISASVAPVCPRDELWFLSHFGAFFGPPHYHHHTPHTHPPPTPKMAHLASFRPLFPPFCPWVDFGFHSFLVIFLAPNSSVAKNRGPPTCQHTAENGPQGGQPKITHSARKWPWLVWLSWGSNFGFWVEKWILGVGGPLSAGKATKTT